MDLLDTWLKFTPHMSQSAPDQQSGFGEPIFLTRHVKMVAWYLCTEPIDYTVYSTIYQTVPRLTAITMLWTLSTVLVWLLLRWSIWMDIFAWLSSKFEHTVPSSNNYNMMEQIFLKSVPSCYAFLSAFGFSFSTIWRRPAGTPQSSIFTTFLKMLCFDNLWKENIW